jgi:oligo-1,6-glucosidase
VNPNYKEINAAAQAADPNSVLSHTQKAIALRHAHPAFVYGDYQDLDPAHKQVFAYTRVLGGERFLVVLNVSPKAVEYKLPAGLKTREALLTNISQPETGAATLHLGAWDARVYRY